MASAELLMYCLFLWVFAISASLQFSVYYTNTPGSPLVRASSFLRCLRYLHNAFLVVLGRCKDVLAYPNRYASYTVPVRQYRILQSGFLHCCRHQQAACHLLMLPVVAPAHNGLVPYGKIHPLRLLKKNLYF